MTHLWLACPKREVVERASACEVYGLGWTNEEVGGGDDIENRRVAGIGNWEPEGDGEVVGRTAEGDWEEAVKTEQKLSATVIVCYLKVSDQ